MEKPLVSVNVPVYQHEPFLEQCLDSILSQKTTFPFEIVIGEDESSDRSREICIKYKEKFPDRITLVFNKRSDVVYVDGIPTGRYNSFSLLSKSQGKYIAILEGDDFWGSEDKLQKQVEFLENNTEYSGSYHDTIKFFIDENGNMIENMFRENLPLKVEVTDTLSRLTPFHTSSLLFKKECLEVIPDFFWKIHSADMALFSVIAGFGPLGYVGDVYSYYRNHNGGITKKESFKLNFHRNRIKFLWEMDKYHEYKYSTVIRDILKYHKTQIWVQRKAKLRIFLSGTRLKKRK